MNITHICNSVSCDYNIKAVSRMSGLTGDVDMFMSVPSCFTCHKKISWRCSFSFLMRLLFRYAVAVTSIEKAERLQCALQSDSFKEINK